jgi:transmembrane sensor
MHTQRQIDYLQAQRASEWFEILKQGRAQDMLAFREWCRKSPLHIQEFLEITCVDRALDELDFADAEGSEDLMALLRSIPASTGALPARVDPNTARASKTKPSRRRRWRWAMAATVTAFAVGLALYSKPWRPTQEFATKVGEQRTVELVDSSVVTLNTNSDIKVQFGRDARNIELRRGEAVFKVARDPTRPFRVHTRAGTVQAVGTEFNVYDQPGGTDVTVLEGRVRLTSRESNGSGSAVAQEFVAGEEARIALDGSIRRVAQPDIARVTAWSKRRLKFHNEPLEEMVLEFNRYHRDLHLRLEGIPAGSRHYSGIFDADDPATLARFLEREPDLTVERAGREIIIRPKRPED